MIRSLFVSSTLLLAATACGDVDEPIVVGPMVPAAPEATNRAPTIEPLEVADWPPFGPRSTLSTYCSDDIGLRDIRAEFESEPSISLSGRSGSASFAGSALGEGQGTLRIVCCDTGQRCAFREIERFLVDLSPPQIEPDRLAASPTGEGFDGDIAIWVRDAWVLGSVELSFRGKTLLHEFPKAYPSTVGKEWDVSRVTFPAGDLPVGNGKAVVIARDAAGNVSSRELDLRIDATPPVVSVSTSSTSIASGSSFVVQMTSSDPDNPTPTQIDLWVGGARVAKLSGPHAELTVDASTLSPGPSEIRAIARDDAGNESAAAAVVVDILPAP